MRTRPSFRPRCATSALALATVLAVGATPAAAQSLQGTGTIVTNTGGSAGISTGANSTTVTLNPGQTVIDWTPFDNAVGNFGGIGFQYDGSTATFQSTGNFAVLNRVNVADATRIISMDGDINGLVGGQTGGSIYFYSPSGIVLGGNATINVGSLVLSASPITVDGSGNFITGPNNSVIFGQAVNPSAAVNTVGAFGLAPGAAVNASDYVAFVAPRVEHQGTINVAGQAAMVAAEAATIDFTPDGLFNIQVTSGTTDSEGVRIGGDINGPASDGSTNHRIYAVAVPKNQLITMTIATGANLGFDIAGAANVDGNAIVLSAGNNITGGQVGPVAAGNGAGEDWIIIGGVTVTSAFTAQAQSRVHLFTPTNTASTFASDVSLIGPVSAYANAEASGATLTIQGDLLVNSSAVALTQGANVTGGQAQVYAVNGGTVTVNGDTQIFADGSGGGATADNVNGGIGTGGSASAFASGAASTLQLNGDLTVRAVGLGGGASGIGSVGGVGSGGTASISAGGGGDVAIAGTASVSANGVGGAGRAGGGLGDGGTASIQALSPGSSVTIDTDALVFADGDGGSLNCTLCGGFGGSGVGGNASLAAYDGTLDVAGAATVGATGQGGSGGTGGNGSGGGDIAVQTGGAQVLASGTGQLAIGGALTINAGGLGGFGASGLGGAATGGHARIGAFGGGDVDVLGRSIVNSDGGAGNGAVGRGGVSRIDASGGSTIDLFELNLRADGRGGQGNGSTDAGDGYGGTAALIANGTGSSVTVAQQITTGPTIQDRELLSADGFGGNTSGFGDAKGGLGTGGTLDLSVTNGGNVALATTTTNDILVRIRGYGGLATAEGTTGGDAIGGNINIVVDNATMTTGRLQLSSYAQGGGSTDAGFNANGGNGSGGSRLITVRNGATLSTWIPGGVTGGSGGEGSGTGVGGNGSGGVARLTVTDSTLNVLGTTIIVAQNTGGTAAGTGAHGSTTGAQVATADIQGSTVNIANGATLLVAANGFGGPTGGNFLPIGTGPGGNGVAGVAQTNIFNSTVTGGTITTSADAQGGGGTTGAGNANAGTASVNLANATINSDFLIVSANATGGSAGTGNAGDAVAGTARLSALGGNSNLTLVNGVLVSAMGDGGAITGATGLAGDGTGGTATMFAGNGAMTVNGGVNLQARGLGGNGGVGGTGGNGLGGFTTLTTNSPQTITINGTLQMIAPGVGGAGAIGGNAAARTTPPSNEYQITAAQILTDGGGTIAVNGSTFIDVSATGGAGTVGDGGDATGGEVDIAGMNGTTTFGALTITANASGGAGGSAGGAGGNAAGGYVDILRGLSNGTISGPLNFGTVSVTADATGGAGGVGTNGLNGTSGGVGGEALGGQILFTANAAGSSINSGNVSLSVTAAGGRGGDGGLGSAGAGGNGGAGGTARGGFIQTGSISNDLASGAGASMATGNLTLTANALGGSGGTGGVGTTANGVGGAGGDAFGGNSSFGIRGIAASVGNISLFANAVGGNGGSGSTVGSGGDATNGLLSVESKDRFNHPGQRGTLTAGNIFGRAIATAGTGATSGAIIGLGGSYFRVLNGDATIASVDIEIDSGTPGTTADFISSIDGTATITGDFRFVTTNNLSLFANNGSLSAGTLTAWATNFAPDASNQPPAAPGTFFAETFDIVTGDNFVSSANLDSVNLLEIIAPGSITLNDINGGDAVYLNAQGGSIATNDIDAVAEIRTFASTGATLNDLNSNDYIYLNTGGQLTLGNATAATGIDLIGTGGVTFGTLTSGSYVNLYSTGLVQGGPISAQGSIYGFSDGDLTLGTLDAGSWIELVSLGDLTLTGAIAGEYIDLATYLDGDGIVTVGGFVHTGNLTAGDSIEVRAGTNAELGNLSAGIVNPSADPFAEYTIGVLAEDYIVAGNVASTTHAGFASPETITVGDIDVGGIFLALGGGNIATGAITAGTNTYFGNYSMMALGGSLTDDFDPSPILAAAPAATGGNITIGGPVETGEFRALAGGTFTTGAITTSGLLEIRSSGNMTTGNLDSGTQLVFGTNGDALAGSLTSGGTIDARSAGTGTYGNVAAADSLYVGANGALAFGTMIAGETARFGSDTSVSGGNVTAGDSVIGTSGGDITLGNLSAGLIDPSAVPGALYEAVVFGFGDVAVGNIDALGEVQLAGRDSVSAGSIDTPSRMFAVSNGAISLGDLGVDGTILVGGFSMFAYTGNLRTDFDASPTFDSLPVAIGGSFSAGDIATGDLSIAALGNIALGDLSIDGAILLDSGGDLTTGDARSFLSSITLRANGNILAGDLTAADEIVVRGGGNVTTGDLRSGVTIAAAAIGTMDVGPGDAVEVFGNDVVTGAIIADGYVGLYAEGTLTAGAISATHDVIALAGGNANFGGIVTNERFILAGYGNFASLQTPAGFDPEAIFAIYPPALTGGNATFGESVNVSTFASFVGGNTNAGPVRAATDATFASGGTLTLSGPVSAQEGARFLSSDIDITPNATVSANEVSFVSTSASGTFIGDNVDGSGGYRLSQPEIDRVDAGLIEFGIWTDLGGLGVMTIGDLAMDFVGSDYEDVAEFFVGNSQTEEPGGIIRVVGDALFQVTPDQEVSFEAGTIAVNAETGSIALEDGQGNLSGYLGLYAPNIFVASGDILARLEQNPRYSGYIDDLNAPAAIQRPDGVIRAASLEIDSFYAPLANILVQNTGTSALPAGFLITDADIGDGETIPESGSINLVINGQIVTQTGTRTGIQVRDDLVGVFGTDAFVPGSTINGCLLTGGCNKAEELPPAAVVNPTQIDLLTNDPLGETEFGNEPDIDDNIEGDGDGESGEQGSPIAPPQPLFDTRPLVDASLIDDPISGAGNPSLYGADQDDDDQDDEGDAGGVKADDKPAKGEDE